MPMSISNYSVAQAPLGWVGADDATGVNTYRKEIALTGLVASDKVRITVIARVKVHGNTSPDSISFGVNDGADKGINWQDAVAVGTLLYFEGFIYDGAQCSNGVQPGTSAITMSAVSKAYVIMRAGDVNNTLTLLAVEVQKISAG